MNRIFIIVLLGLGLFGGALLIRQRVILSKIKPEYERLVERFGDFVVDDESQFHFRQVESEGHEMVEWRFFRPSSKFGAFGFGCSDVEPYGARFYASELTQTSLIRCHFELRDDLAICHLLHLFGEHRYAFADDELAKFIKTNWEKLDKNFVQEASQAENSVVTLAAIRVPESLKAEFLASVPSMRRFEIELPERPIFQLFAGNEDPVTAKFEQ